MYLVFHIPLHFAHKVIFLGLALIASHKAQQPEGCTEMYLRRNVCETCFFFFLFFTWHHFTCCIQIVRDQHTHKKKKPWHAQFETLMINLSVVVSDVTALWQGLGTFYTEAIESIQTVKIINWDRM